MMLVNSYSCSHNCVQRPPLGNCKVTVIYRVAAIYRLTLQKIYKAIENLGKLSGHRNVQGRYIKV